MIVFISRGRLGNQLFQYAFLKTLAQSGENILTFNLNDLRNIFNLDSHKQHNFYLNKYLLYIFNEWVKPKFINLLVKFHIIGYVYQRSDQFCFYRSYGEKTGWLPITFVESDYYQSEKFFLPEIITYKFKHRIINQAIRILNWVPQGAQPVFVHVRRGDYLRETYQGERGIALPLSYYCQAMKIMGRWLSNPYYLFLSDDPAYVEWRFNNIQNKYVSRNPVAVDLALMSLCRHGIASNSSFSWWGAYLMENRKKVIFPKYWYGWRKKMESHVDIQPQWAEIIEVE